MVSILLFWDHDRPEGMNVHECFVSMYDILPYICFALSQYLSAPSV